MSTLNYNPRRVWTIAQAKARLSHKQFGTDSNGKEVQTQKRWFGYELHLLGEVLRLAEEEGPQHIGCH